MSKISAFVALSLLTISLVACGGGGSTPPPTPTPPPAIVVTPSSANVALNSSQTFTANAAGVTWTVSGPGSINANGVYSAPASFPGNAPANQATVTATLGGNTGTAKANVVYPNTHGTFQAGAIKLGTSGGNVNDTNATGCCIGTLGSLIDRGGSLFILSNNHVLARSGVAANGELINQPGPTACFGLNKNVASLTQAAPIKPTAGSDPAGCSGSTAPLCGQSPSKVDAAIAAIVTGTVDATGTILDLGPASATSIADLPPSATPFVGLPAAGQGVAKSGRTSGLTCSTVQSVGGTVRVSYDGSCGGTTAFDATFPNQIFINGGNFLQAGDSGSLLVTSDTARALGLLYAAGSTSAVANPIDAVFAAFTQAGPPQVVPVIAGSQADHAVSCVPTASLASTQVPGGGASTLTAGQRQLVARVRERHARVLMADTAIKSVEVGASADNPGEGALLIEVGGPTRTPVPATIEGVRTRIISPQASLPAITQEVIKSSLAIMHAHEDAYMAQKGVQGIAVGRSDDNPAEPAIVIYTITGVKHDPIPPLIGGIRTKVLEGTRFHAN